jgi:hypothetical protein
MKNSNIAQEKTQAPSPDEMQDLNGQKLIKNQETANFFAKLFAKKAEKVVLGKEVKKKKSLQWQKKNFLIKRTGLPKSWLKKTLKPKRCFGLDGPHIPQWEKLNIFVHIFKK